MLRFTQGNLLDADVEALVNTVNTVGVMGKGIALMFKEAFPSAFKEYAEACESGDIKVGQMHLVDRGALFNPRFIINFPTKKHWRHPSRMEWISDGLEDLKRVIAEHQIKSIALPPLGSGNGKLEWTGVRQEIERVLGDLNEVDVLVYEPTRQYQNVMKKEGKENLTPARAIITELIRRYLILGIDCTVLEVQKLAWFAERMIRQTGSDNFLNLQFSQNRYGPYAHRLSYLIDSIDGSYLHCSKRIADSSPTDPVWVDPARSEKVEVYLRSNAKVASEVIEKTAALIDGFESPLGLELLSTVDWIINEDRVEPTLEKVKAAIATWPGGPGSGARKASIFDDRLIMLALERLRINLH
ncbi:macro domain-containing protein [Leptolyngbya sp. 7M]|uniref:type II toxin-antitoxin system antitoxin DNA ADP-ribosyl glycohydrolase DarG n=1 Tax=Leptolyngbya sp. 7M TaxID=2812896 RepID=UPI001B8AA693|nr:macro domain-containing protein [Leptolyngbya sp. 7M]QYO62607.1 macro domain-containing protein [Leptolyngbya sp. 7M]QYU70934.1 macro domain-containing protein [Leptolyngbya sp. 15MV]